MTDKLKIYNVFDIREAVVLAATKVEARKLVEDFIVKNWYSLQGLKEERKELELRSPVYVKALSEAEAKAYPVYPEDEGNDLTEGVDEVKYWMTPKGNAWDLRGDKPNIITIEPWA
jgi:hypothetical protein